MEKAQKIRGTQRQSGHPKPQKNPNSSIFQNFQPIKFLQKDISRTPDVLRTIRPEIKLKKTRMFQPQTASRSELSKPSIVG